MATELVEKGLLLPVEKGLLLPVEKGLLLPVEKGLLFPVDRATRVEEVAVAMLKKAGNFPAGLTPSTIPLWQ
jgi:hypothetical protein